MVTTRIPSESRVVLRNISRQTFETMLAEMGEDRASRLTYDRGTLEIMTPLLPHQYWNRLIEYLIFVLGNHTGEAAAHCVAFPVSSPGTRDANCRRKFAIA